MIAIDWNPDRKTLRTFAIGLLVLACVYAGWLVWQGQLTSPALWVCGLAAGLGLVGAIAPPWLRWVYVAWMIVVFPIGWCVFQVILGITYFGLIWPIGVLLKWRGRDPLRLRSDQTPSSFWSERLQSDDPRRHFRQY